MGILNLTGNFQEGFNATMQIGTEGEIYQVGATGSLPQNPAIEDGYRKYNSLHNNLAVRFPGYRIGEILDKRKGSNLKDYKDTSDKLVSDLNLWLQNSSFSKIREVLESAISKSQEQEFVLTIQNNTSEVLRKLPWHLWDILEKNNIEAIIASPEFDTQQVIGKRLRAKPRILVILGNSDGIDIDIDRNLFKIIQQKRGSRDCLS